MKFFNRNEALIAGLILVVVVSVTLANLRVANRRSRDAQRRDDIKSVASALEKYKSEYAFVPPSVDGKILGCKGDKFEEFMMSQNPSDIDNFFQLLRPCEWGQDSFTDLTDEAEPYLQVIPSDPRPEVSQYLYLSSGKRFQLFAYLEGERDAEQYNEAVFQRQLNCGGKACNFGVTIEFTPLDISLEDYEAQLQAIENE